MCQSLPWTFPATARDLWPCSASNGSGRFIFLTGGWSMHLLRVILVVALVLPAVGFAAEGDATAALHALFDRDWEYQMQQNPLWASSLGDRRWNDKWDDESLEAIAARYRHSHE